MLQDTFVLATETVTLGDVKYLGGACDTDTDRAVRRAHGEAVERAALLGNGPGLALSRRQAEERGCRLDPVDPDLSGAVRWVAGHDVVTGEPVALPAELVLVGSRTPDEVRWQQSSVGAASHPHPDVALENGLLECLERFHVRRLWAGRARVDPATGRLPEAVSPGVSAALGACGLTPWAWFLADAAPLFVAVVMLAGRQSRATFGSSARVGPDDALHHALCEALSVRVALAGKQALRGDPRTEYALRASKHQGLFLEFLEAQRVGPTPRAQADHTPIAEVVTRQIGRQPWVVPLPFDGEASVQRVFVPSPAVLLPRGRRDFILSPGYLE